MELRPLGLGKKEVREAEGEPLDEPTVTEALEDDVNDELSCDEERVVARAMLRDS
jgi:hypothetical protein